jgi:hypothetical protein
MKLSSVSHNSKYMCLLYVLETSLLMWGIQIGEMFSEISQPILVVSAIWIPLISNEVSNSQKRYV